MRHLAAIAVWRLPGGLHLVMLHLVIGGSFAVNLQTGDIVKNVPTGVPKIEEPRFFRNQPAGASNTVRELPCRCASTTVHNTVDQLPCRCYAHGAPARLHKRSIPKKNRHSKSVNDVPMGSRRTTLFMFVVTTLTTLSTKNRKWEPTAVIIQE